jgi:hypothetical protein
MPTPKRRQGRSSSRTVVVELPRVVFKVALLASVVSVLVVKLQLFILESAMTKNAVS